MESRYIYVSKHRRIKADVLKNDYIFLPAMSEEEVLEINSFNDTIAADMIAARHEKRIKRRKEEAKKKILAEQNIRKKLSSIIDD